MPPSRKRSAENDAHNTLAKRKSSRKRSLITLTPREKPKFSDAYPPDGEQPDGRGPGCKGSQSHCPGRKAGPGLSTRHKDLRLPAYRKQLWVKVWRAEPSQARMYTPELR
jgi:hypothetical protein